MQKLRWDFDQDQIHQNQQELDNNGMCRKSKLLKSIEEFFCYEVNDSMSLRTRNQACFTNMEGNFISPIPKQPFLSSSPSRPVLYCSVPYPSLTCPLPVPYPSLTHPLLLHYRARPYRNSSCFSIKFNQVKFNNFM